MFLPPSPPCVGSANPVPGTFELDSRILYGEMIVSVVSMDKQGRGAQQLAQRPELAHRTKFIRQPTSLLVVG